MLTAIISINLSYLHQHNGYFTENRELKFLSHQE
jgi:hypothetical protein